MNELWLLSRYIYVKSLLELSNQINELNRYIRHIDVPKRHNNNLIFFNTSFLQLNLKLVLKRIENEVNKAYNFHL
jgi:hypothetical protein